MGRDYKRPREDRGDIHYRSLFSLFSLALVLFCIYSRLFIFDTCIVLEDSMYPTLHAGDRIIARNWNYGKLEPKRGDIIVLPAPSDGRLVVKRIIGLPGETILLQAGQVYINGKLLQEDYVAEQMVILEPQLFFVPENYIFIMGDNRNNSEDSRHFGCVAISTIRSRVSFCFWPLSRAGRI